MKTEKELNSDILKVTKIIAERFPELSKYMAEMPVKIKESPVPEINLKNLSDYNDSLHTLLSNYSDCYNSHEGKNHFYSAGPDIFKIIL